MMEMPRVLMRSDAPKMRLAFVSSVHTAPSGDAADRAHLHGAQVRRKLDPVAPLGACLWPPGLTRSARTDLEAIVFASFALRDGASSNAARGAAGFGVSPQSPARCRTGGETLRSRERPAPMRVLPPGLIKFADSRMQLALVSCVHAAPAGDVAECTHLRGERSRREMALLASLRSCRRPSRCSRSARSDLGVLDLVALVLFGGGAAAAIRGLAVHSAPLLPFPCFRSCEK